MLRRGAVVAATAATALALCACGEAEPPRAATPGPPRSVAAPASVLLVTIDTLRPDAVGWISGKGTTPAFDALAAEGFRFPGAVAPVPLTLPSHTSVMTGLVPHRHGVHDNGQVVAAALPTMAELLGAAGYDTAAFVSGFPLRAMFGLDRGFGTYDDALPGDGGTPGRERRAMDTTAAALAWLEARRTSPAAPFFLWVHYYDPHDPYDPPAGFARDGERGDYDGEVAYADAALGKLRSGIARAAPGVLLLTIVTGDHGEALGEHDEPTHGFFVYDSTILVPLVLHMPGAIPSGESRAPARLVDLLPTVLDAAALPRAEGLDGASLLPLVAGRTREAPPAVVESWQPWLGYGWAPLIALRTAEAKLVVAPRPELYDLAQDPVELANQAEARPELAAELRRRLEALTREPGGTTARVDDPAVREQLGALGYLQGGGSDAPAPSGLADPKERVQLMNLLAGGEELLGAGELVEARAIFEVVLDEEPDNRYALLRLGQILLQQGDPANAVAPLARLTTLDPDHNEARFALADAYSRQRRLPEARQQWLALVARQPRRTMAWSNLGTIQLQEGELDEALHSFEEALTLDSGNHVAASNLGDCLVLIARRDLASGAVEPLRRRLAGWAARSPIVRERLSKEPALAALLSQPGA